MKTYTYEEEVEIIKQLTLEQCYELRHHLNAVCQELQNDIMAELIQPLKNETIVMLSEVIASLQDDISSYADKDGFQDVIEGKKEDIALLSNVMAKIKKSKQNDYQRMQIEINQLLCNISEDRGFSTGDEYGSLNELLARRIESDDWSASIKELDQQRHSIVSLTQSLQSKDDRKNLLDFAAAKKAINLKDFTKRPDRGGLPAEFWKIIDGIYEFFGFEPPQVGNKRAKMAKNIHSHFGKMASESVKEKEQRASRPKRPKPSSSIS